MKLISTLAVPLMIAGIIGFALIKKVRVYDSFLEGASDGLRCTFNIAPPLIGLVIAISMLRSSGFIDILSNLLSPFLKAVSMPAEVMPLALLRPVSGSGSIAILSDIFNNCGVDSYAGKVASVMMGSTETTFYTIAVYFGAINCKDSKYTLKSALIGDFTGIFLSIVTVMLFL
ncbi:MAG: spore maturation protein [Ruminococcaceae bacterium]|nr:spore maturation protein [Oscillospiraceae bacterium]